MRGRGSAVLGPGIEPVAGDAGRGSRGRAGFGADRAGEPCSSLNVHIIRVRFIYSMRYRCGFRVIFLYDSTLLNGGPRRWRGCGLECDSGNGARTANAQRYTAELGYGFGARRLWYPYVGTESGGASSPALRVGLKLNAGSDQEAGLEIRRRAHLSGQMENDIRLQWSARW